MRVTVRLSPAEAAALDAACRARGLDRSAAMRQALAAWLAADDASVGARLAAIEAALRLLEARGVAPPDPGPPAPDALAAARASVAALMDAWDG